MRLVDVMSLLLQGLDTAHKQRVAEVLGDPEVREKQRSRESLTSDTVKYESGPDGGEEVSMSVEWNGVSTVHTAQQLTHYIDKKYRVRRCIKCINFYKTRHNHLLLLTSRIKLCDV